MPSNKLSGEVHDLLQRPEPEIVTARKLLRAQADVIYRLEGEIRHAVAAPRILLDSLRREQERSADRESALVATIESQRARIEGLKGAE